MEFVRSVGKSCSCISRVSEHWRRNPLQSSSKPGKGTGRAMALATTGAGDVEVLLTEVLGGFSGTFVVSGRRLCKAAMISCRD